MAAPDQFSYINSHYGLSVKRGTRLEYSGNKNKTKLGTVTSASGAHINIRFDGEAKATGPFHPTWAIRYLTPEAPSHV